MKDLKKEMEKNFKEILGLLIRCFFSWLRSKIDHNFEHNPNYYKTTAKDKADPRDYKFGEIFGDYIEKELPKKVDLFDGDILNQGSTLHCVGYATTGGINENDYFFTKKQLNLNPNIIVDYIRNNIDSNIDNEGTYIVNGPKSAKAQGYIDYYVAVNSITAIKRALDMGTAIITGTNKLDWRKTGKNGVAVAGNGSGHAIHLNGYDDDIELTDANGKKYKGAFKVKNTWGDTWGNGGHYWFPYELFDLLFNSKYAIFQNKEKSVELYKGGNFDGYNQEQKEILNNMKKLNFWNGKNPDTPITRAEVMFIINAVLQHINKK